MIQFIQKHNQRLHPSKTVLCFHEIFKIFKIFLQGRTECVCDEEEGFVFWNETQKCYRVYTQGPCPNNAWLIPADDLTEVFCECQPGYHFSPRDPP